MRTSRLIKNQKQTFTREFMEYDEIQVLTVTLRYDDECGNGHNTFAMAATQRHKVSRQIDCCGCMHKTIVQVFPEFEHLVKWHLCSSDGPMHYIANTVYHADQHGPDKCHIKFNDAKNGLSMSSLKYCSILEGEQIARTHSDLYSIAIDQKTEKAANLNAARSSAIWPDATDEELLADDLEAKLTLRLPALLDTFCYTMVTLGFEY